MPKRFGDRDQTKCSSQDGNFKPGQTVLKGCGKQAVISYIKTPCSRDILQNNDMSPRKFFHPVLGVMLCFQVLGRGICVKSTCLFVLSIFRFKFVLLLNSYKICLKHC